MRKALWFVPMLLLVTGTALAQAPAAKPATPAKAPAAAAPAAPKAEAAPTEAAPKAPKLKPAKLTADPATVDLGTVDAASTKDVTFTLKNEGEKESKKVSCKATGFTFDKSKVAIAGGSSETFKGTYTAPKKAPKADKPIKSKIRCGTVKVTATGTLKAAPAPTK